MVAATDYAGLVDRWADAMETDTGDVEFMARVDSVIRDAELRCYRDLDPVFCRRVAQAVTVTPGSRVVALPAECWIPRRLVVVVGSVRTALRHRELSMLDAYWPDATVTGVPKYWTMPVEGTVYLAPTPAAVALQLDFTFRPAALAADNTTTYLSLQYPDLLFYAGMIGFAGWSKNYGTGDDPKQAPYWSAQYADQLARAQLEERQKAVGVMAVG